MSKAWTAYGNLGAAPASGDTLLVLDVSDTTDDASGTVKQVTFSNLTVGDMLAATYDPTAVAGDAFDMDNMVEGTNLILSSAERAIIADAMLATAYDPTSVAGDAFDMDNMIEGGTNLILTAAERSVISGVPLDNLVATAAPDATNDDSESYAVGSRWLDTLTGYWYICSDATTDNAVWEGLSNNNPVDDNTIELDKLVEIGEARVLGRADGAGTGPVVALTGAEVAAVIGQFAAGADGVVPDPVTATGTQVLIDTGWALISSIVGGLTALTDDDAVAVDDLTTLAASTHGFRVLSGTDLVWQPVLLRNSSTQSDPVDVVVPDDFERFVQLHKASDQTGPVRINALRTLGYDNLGGGGFTVGEYVEDQTSGARGRIFADTGSILTLVDISGTFGDDNQIVGDDSSETADVDGTITGTSTVNGQTTVTLVGARSRAWLTWLATGDFDVAGDTEGDTTLGDVTITGTLDVAGAVTLDTTLDVTGLSTLATALATDDWNLADNVLQRPELLDYSETSTEPSSSSNVLTLNLTLGNVFQTTLTEDVTTLTISNPPATGKAGNFTLIVVQGAGPYAITWPAEVLWPGGSAPTLSAGDGDIDVFAFVTRDAGTSWYGFVGGQDFS